MDRHHRVNDAGRWAKVVAEWVAAITAMATATAPAPVVAARPHPRTVCWRNWYFENAADDAAVLQHVEIVLVPANPRAFEN
jgi:hypothetical protein